MDSDSTLSDPGMEMKAVCGVPRAILTCRQNSHPFQERVLNLDQPVKIGRSVARTRASVSNGIFDCKVLSRNHAVMWYENERFYIQDTKSSNGTFVNSQRLSRGAEDSPPRELWSEDILQFGVDVLENQRKGNEDSDSCDDSVHIVTHGCIVATVKLIYPNGKEAKPRIWQAWTKEISECFEHLNVANRMLKEVLVSNLDPTEKEAQQREERLKGKLEEIEVIVYEIQERSRDAVNQHFEESRLLSKIETLEKRIKVLNKMKSGETTESEMISQLLSEVEKVQTVSRSIQEGLHRQLLVSEEKLTSAKREASNLQLEIQAIKDASKLNESKIQELATKCSGYLSTIENLEAMVKTQKKENVDLELRLEGLQVREEILQKLLAHPLGKVLYEHLLLEDGYESLRESGANVDKVVSEWYDKFFPVLKDHVNEEDAWKLIRRLLESIFAEMDQCRKEFEDLTSKKQALIVKLDAARLPHHPIVKTENYTVDELGDGKVIQGVTKNNESVAALEKELKEVEDLLWEVIMKRKTFESRCKNMKVDLDSATKNVEKCEINDEKTDSDHQEPFTVDHLRQLVETFAASETEKGDDNYEKFILPKKQDDSTQTEKITSLTKETTTEGLEIHEETVPSNIESLEAISCIDAVIEEHLSKSDENSSGTEQDSLDAVEENVKSLQSSIENDTANFSAKDDDTSYSFFLNDKAPPISVEEPSAAESPGEQNDTTDNAKKPLETAEARKLQELMLSGDVSPESLTLWEKFRKIYAFCDETLSGIPADDDRLASAREMLTLVSDDVVALLVHDRQREEERRQLQERLSQSVTQEDMAALTFADRFLAIVVGLVICYVGSRILEGFGFA